MMKYKMVCLLVVKDPGLCSPKSFEQEIEKFNQANKDGMEVEVISLARESKMEYGVKILDAIDAKAEEVYVEVEVRADYPDRDKFESEEDYDEAVTRAELESLKGLIEEELER